MKRILISMYKNKVVLRWKNIYIILVTQIFKDDSDVGTVMTLWLITRGRDWCQQGKGKLVPGHDK